MSLTKVTSNMIEDVVGATTNNTDQDFRMDTRTAITSFPVPCVRPTTLDTVIAVDIVPNGTPAEFGTNGFAWIDVCDTDVQTTNPPLNAARVGITGTNVEFGSRAFNGASPKPVYFTLGGKAIVAIFADENIQIGANPGVNGRRYMLFKNYSSGSSAYTDMTINGDGVNSLSLRHYSSTFAFDSGAYADASHIVGVGTKPLVIDGNAGIRFTTGSALSTNERGRIGLTNGFTKFTNNASYVADGTDRSDQPYHAFFSNQNQSCLISFCSNTGSSVAGFHSALPTGSTGYHYRGFLTGTGFNYQVLANGDVQNTNNSYGAISDIKVKENIEPARGYLNDLNNVEVVKYSLKNEKSKKATQLGVIAQQLEQIFPGMIEEIDDYEEVEKIVEIEKTRQVTERKLVESTINEIVEIDGKWVEQKIVKSEELSVPMFDEHPLYDESGNPIIVEVSECLNEDGSVTPAYSYHKTHRVPRMEKYIEQITVKEQVPTGTKTKAVKYSVFVPMLITAVQELSAEVNKLKTFAGQAD